jgi:hypothetical protein
MPGKTHGVSIKARKAKKYMHIRKERKLSFFIEKNGKHRNLV